jgi:hypothetical protein
MVNQNLMVVYAKGLSAWESYAALNPAAMQLHRVKPAVCHPGLLFWPKQIINPGLARIVNPA